MQIKYLVVTNQKLVILLYWYDSGKQSGISSKDLWTKNQYPSVVTSLSFYLWDTTLLRITKSHGVTQAHKTLLDISVNFQTKLKTMANLHIRTEKNIRLTN